MNTPFDAERDLTMTRIIKAPRNVVWDAWTIPAQLEQWFVPSPTKVKVLRMELRSGGAFVTQMSEDGGEWVPHITGSILSVTEGEQFVFSDSLLTNFRPAEHPFMTAIITLRDHPQGTEYHAHVMHKNKAMRDEHDELGFLDGWGSVADQLAKLVEKQN